MHLIVSCGVIFKSLVADSISLPAKNSLYKVVPLLLEIQPKVNAVHFHIFRVYVGVLKSCGA